MCLCGTLNSFSTSVNCSPSSVWHEREHLVSGRQSKLLPLQIYSTQIHHANVYQLLQVYLPWEIPGSTWHELFQTIGEISWLAYRTRTLTGDSDLDFVMDFLEEWTVRIYTPVITFVIVQLEDHLGQKNEWVNCHTWSLDGSSFYRGCETDNRVPKGECKMC